MKLRFLPALLLIGCVGLGTAALAAEPTDRLRIFIPTDIENELDDAQSLDWMLP